MEIWAIILLFLTALILLLLFILIIRTLAFKSKQAVIPEASGELIDIPGSAERLSGAVQIQTVSNLDQSRVDYAPFTRFHDYLEKAFPLVHSTLDRQIINDYGLVYNWKGRDLQKKPVLLIAHYDVVPAWKEGWQYPPFSGAIDQGYIWGRGTLDDKGSLLGILEAIEFLIGEGFQPSRGICLASGFDEEVGGSRGAARIAAHFREQSQRFEYVLDEGMAATRGVVPGIAAWVALVGLAEKGYVSLELKAEAEGGHAAQPPRQTTVGIVAAAIDKLQSNPFPARLTGPAAALFDYLGPHMPLLQKMVFANMWLFAPVVKKQLAAKPVTDASIRTTTAPTMFQGSPQDNILPMQATAVINFRILQGDTVQSVIERVKAVINEPRVRVTEIAQNIFEPSPVSGTDSWSFDMLNRTIREVMPGALVAPSLVLGRTDCTYFTGLSECCYRFVPQRMPAEDLPSVHGINERISLESYHEMINFYIRLLRKSCT